MDGLTPPVKHLRVESPEPTEADSKDGEPAGRTVIQPSVSETAMAWHRIELNMDIEPIKHGGPDGEMHLPQMAGEGNEGTEVISVQDSVICEAWQGWEDSLRMAHRMQWVAGATLWDRLRGEPSEQVNKLTEKEEENLRKWKEQFLEEEESFEEYSMEVNAFGMDDWSD